MIVIGDDQPFGSAHREAPALIGKVSANVQQLTGQDAMFIYLETDKAPLHGGGFATYDPSTAPGGRVSFQDILTQVESRLHLLPQLRRKLVRVPFDLDHPYWVDDSSFDLEYHVRHIALPRPGDWRQLCVQAARLLGRPLDRSRPLWEIYVVDGLEEIPGLPEGSFATVTKLHHAAVDGVAGTELNAVLHTATPELVDPSDIESWEPEAQPSTFDLLGRTARNYAARPRHFVSAVSHTLPVVGRLQRGVRSGELRRQGFRAPGQRFNGSIDARRVVDACEFELTDLKRIRTGVPGATVNDVVLAIVGGTLRGYLGAKGELPDEPLVALIPVSVRSDEQRSASGNQVTTMRATFATHLSDPLERLAAIHESTAQSKLLGQAIGAQTLADYSEFLPGGLLGLGTRAVLASGLVERVAMLNVAVTNIPGPQSPWYLAGARLVSTYGAPPIFDGSGLIHLVFSYCGHVFVSTWSCPKVLPDIEAYSDAMRSAYSELSKAVP